jgi:glycosyltransferase involved in cell wall biosynthesis
MFNPAKLDICFLAGTLGQGGAERQLFYILKSLRESGARVRLLCLTRGEYWEHKIRALGVPITWIGQRGARALRLSRIIQTLRQQPSQIVQSQHFYTNLYAATAARVLGLREIGAMRNDAVSEVRANGALLGRLSLRTPRVMAANSQQAIGNAIRMGVSASRLHFLPNVVDTELFKPAPRAASEVVRLITVGRLTEQKRMDRFFSILASLRQKTGKEIKATVVGDGPLRQELEQQAARLGLLPDAIEFRGKVADTSTVYREADIMVLTSDYEGTPNVLLEAMACGLPVVATRVGGVPEIVRQDETGKLVAAGDENAMTEALLMLTNNPSRRRELGARARQFVLNNHSPVILPQRLASLYEAILP